jgi:acyl-CoA thioester hydrolase
MSINLSTKKIIKDWTDYNNHLNIAYYILIFDLYGAEVLMNKFKMGEQSAKTKKKKYNGCGISHCLSSGGS